MTEAVAVRQDIRPMQIGLLNLMPNKIKTELQIARLLGASPLQVELSLIRLGNHKPRNTSEDHLHDLLPDVGDSEGPQIRRLHRHRHAGRDDPLRGGHLLAGDAADLRVDAHQRAFNDECLLGRDGGALSFPRRAEAPAAGKSVRRLPAEHSEADLQPYLSGFSDDFTIPISRWAEIRAADLEGRPGSHAIGAFRGERAFASSRTERSGASTCSTISNTIRPHSPTNISAT